MASGNLLSELTVELAPLILGLIARGILLNLNKEIIGIVMVRIKIVIQEQLIGFGCLLRI